MVPIGATRQRPELLSNDFSSDWGGLYLSMARVWGHGNNNCVSDVIIHPLRCTYTLFTIQNGRFHSGSRPKKLSSCSRPKVAFHSSRRTGSQKRSMCLATRWNHGGTKHNRNGDRPLRNFRVINIPPRWPEHLSKGGRSGISMFLFSLQLWQVLQPDSDAWTKIVRNVTMCLSVSPKGARSRGQEDEELLVRMPQKRAKLS